MEEFPDEDLPNLRYGAILVDHNLDPEEGLKQLLAVEKNIPNNLELQVKIAKAYFKTSKMGLHDKLA